MRTISLSQPKSIVFGSGCALQCAEEMLAAGLQHAFIVTAPPLVGLAQPLADALRKAGASATIYAQIAAEPTVKAFEQALQAARGAQPDAVIGLGGGSALDVAKLVAALYDGRQDIRDVFGIRKLTGRSKYLACLPTTAGTGSEVSPNALLLDETDHLKKGVISPHLLPDAAYVDPLLTIGAPPAVTAATGMDALVHCVEAYANRFSHPAVDLYALQGIRLIGANLLCAVEHGDDIDARTAMALGSMYGGLCLGPVNTAGVHALAYPLGGEFHVAHGVSNAVLLPHVLQFNLPAAPERYAEIALALGAKATGDALETAQGGLSRLRDLSRRCSIPQSLSDLGMPVDSIPRLVQSAMTVTRLLKNNVREITASDAEAIYRAAFGG